MHQSSEEFKARPLHEQILGSVAGAVVPLGALDTAVATPLRVLGRAGKAIPVKRELALGAAGAAGGAVINDEDRAKGAAAGGALGVLGGSATRLSRPGRNLSVTGQRVGSETVRQATPPNLRDKPVLAGAGDGIPEGWERLETGDLVKGDLRIRFDPDAPEAEAYSAYYQGSRIAAGADEDTAIRLGQESADAMGGSFFAGADLGRAATRSTDEVDLTVPRDDASDAFAQPQLSDELSEGGQQGLRPAEEVPEPATRSAGETPPAEALGGRPDVPQDFQRDYPAVRSDVRVADIGARPGTFQGRYTGVESDPRHYQDAAVRQLEQQMREFGYKQDEPIEVIRTPDAWKKGDDASEYTVWTGHHRLEAAKRAELDRIPVNVTQIDVRDPSDLEALRDAAIRANAAREQGVGDKLLVARHVLKRFDDDEFFDRIGEYMARADSAEQREFYHLAQLPERWTDVIANSRTYAYYESLGAKYAGSFRALGVSEGDLDAILQKLVDEPNRWGSSIAQWERTLDNMERMLQSRSQGSFDNILDLVDESAQKSPEELGKLKVERLKRDRAALRGIPEGPYREAGEKWYNDAIENLSRPDSTIKDMPTAGPDFPAAPAIVDAIQPRTKAERMAARGFADTIREAQVEGKGEDLEKLLAEAKQQIEGLEAVKPTDPETLKAAELKGRAKGREQEKSAAKNRSTKSEVTKLLKRDAKAEKAREQADTLFDDIDELLADVDMAENPRMEKVYNEARARLDKANEADTAQKALRSLALTSKKAPRSGDVADTEWAKALREVAEGPLVRPPPPPDARPLSVPMSGADAANIFEKNIPFARKGYENKPLPSERVTNLYRRWRYQEPAAKQSVYRSIDRSTRQRRQRLRGAVSSYATEVQKNLSAALDDVGIRVNRDNRIEVRGRLLTDDDGYAPPAWDVFEESTDAGKDVAGQLTREQHTAINEFYRVQHQIRSTAYEHKVPMRQDPGIGPTGIWTGRAIKGANAQRGPSFSFGMERTQARTYTSAQEAEEAGKTFMRFWEGYQARVTGELTAVADELAARGIRKHAIDPSAIATARKAGKAARKAGEVPQAIEASQVRLPAFTEDFFDPDIAAHTQLRLANPAELGLPERTVLSVARMFLLGLDLAVPMIQGLAAAHRTALFAKNFVPIYFRALRFAFEELRGNQRYWSASRKALGKKVREETDGEWSIERLSWNSLQLQGARGNAEEFTAASETTALLRQIPGVVGEGSARLFEAANAFHAGYLDEWKVLFALDDVKMRRAAGKLTGQKLVDAVNDDNTLTSRLFGASTSGATRIEQAIELAPSYVRSQWEIMLDAVRGLDPRAPESAAKARNFIVFNFLKTATAVTMVNALRGEETILDPRDSNFMAIRNVGGRDLRILAPALQPFRLVAKVLTGGYEGGVKGSLNELKGYAQSKANPLPSLLISSLEGETFLGKKFDVIGDPAGAALEGARSFAPISVQEATREGAGTAALSSFGFNVNPLTGAEKRNRARDKAAREATGEPGPSFVDRLIPGEGEGEYHSDNLTAAQRAEINRQPEVVAGLEQAEQDATSRTGDRSTATTLRSESRDLIQRAGQALESGEITGYEYRKVYGNEKAQLAAQLDMLDLWESDPLVAGWYDLYEDAKDQIGQIDFDLLEELQGSYEAENPGTRAAAEKYAGSLDDVVSQEYREARVLANEYYSIPAYRTMTVDESKIASKALSYASQMVRFGQARNRNQALSRISTIFGPEWSRAARKAIKVGANPARKRFIKANSLFTKFYSGLPTLLLED